MFTPRWIPHGRGDGVIPNGHAERCRAAVLIGVVFVAVTATVPRSSVVAGPVQSFEDVRWWVGDGSRRAALAIDWAGQDSEANSLVWGFRWDGEATSADMLQAIIASDSRLYAKLGPLGNLGTAVYGIGYDASGDGEFALDDGTVFDDRGLAITGPADLAQAIDPTDFYREGWFLGYWHQGVAQDPPVEWSSGPGLSSRILSDGAWDSLAFTNSIFEPSFASGLMAAERTRLIGDYDRNGIVDAADFTVWRDSLGQTVPAAGFGADGNFDWIIDPSDFVIWQESFGKTEPDSSGGSTIPEPNPRWMFFIVFLSLTNRRRTQRK